MVIVLRGSEREQYSYYFDKMFRLRHDVFIRARGWSLPCANEREIDQYDTEDAVYFLDLDEEDQIQGSVRITPTDKSSLLADYFPHLVENGEPPRTRDIYECTRYIVLPRRKSRENNRAAKGRMLTTMVEWCLHHDISFIQTVIDTGTLSAYLEFTPQIIPLGLSHPYGGGRKTPGGGDCMAIRWPITPETLGDMRAFGRVDAPQAPAFDHAAVETPAVMAH